MRRLIYALLLILWPLAAHAQPVWTQGDKCRVPGGWPLQYGIEDTTGLLGIFDFANDTNSSATKNATFSTNNLRLYQGTADNQSTAVNDPYKVEDFDGNDYLPQQVISSGIGVSSYTTESGVSTFTDAGQAFTNFQTASGNAAYHIVVTNTDATISWGYLGAAVDATEIRVYTTRALTTTGWNVTNPATKTPSTYAVYRSDFNLLGDQTHILLVKPDDGQPAEQDILVSKWSGTVGQYANYLAIDTDGKLHIYVSRDGGATNKFEQRTNAAVFADGAQNKYILVAATYDSSGSVAIYVDGILIPSTITGSFQSSVFDTPAPLMLGARASGTQMLYSGRVGLYIPFARALSAAENAAIANSCTVQKRLR